MHLRVTDYCNFFNMKTSYFRHSVKPLLMLWMFRIFPKQSQHGYIDKFFDCLNVSRTYSGQDNRKDALMPYFTKDNWRFDVSITNFLWLIAGLILRIRTYLRYKGQIGKKGYSELEWLSSESYWCSYPGFTNQPKKQLLWSDVARN